VHGETPGGRTVAGGVIIVLAIVVHILWQARRRGDQVPVPSA
jgi:FtsZ-interacting cell division protein ZipA